MSRQNKKKETYSTTLQKLTFQGNPFKRWPSTDVCVHICIHVYNFYPHLYGHLHALVFRIGSSPTGGLSAKASGNDRFRPKKCERRPPNLVESWPTFWGRFLVHKTGLLHVMLQGGPNFGAPKGVHFWDRKFA